MDAVINVEETVGKTVGRRTVPNPLRVRATDVEAARESRRVIGGIRVPRGFYKFRSHEEANKWLMNHLVAAATRS